MTYILSLMTRKALIAAFVLLYVFSIHANAASVVSDVNFPVKLSIKNYGIYSLVERSDKAFVADATAGYSSVVTAKLLDQTHRIPLKQHTVFGFNYIIEDHSSNSLWVPVEIQITHPPTTNYLGHESRGFRKQSSAKKKADGGYHNSAFYLLSEPYELVAGKWSISVTYRGEHVLKVDFVVESK